MARFGVVPVGVEQRVHPVRLGDLGLGRRPTKPPVAELAGKPRDPARNRDEDLVGGPPAIPKDRPADPP
jgi:hypothetical protein